MEVTSSFSPTFLCALATTRVKYNNALATRSRSNLLTYLAFLCVYCILLQVLRNQQNNIQTKVGTNIMAHYHSKLIAPQAMLTLVENSLKHCLTSGQTAVLATTTVALCYFHH